MALQLPKIEALLENVPANTLSVKVGSGTTRYLPADNYFLSSQPSDGASDSLLNAVAALISVDVPGSTLTMSPTTGLVTIQFGSGSHTLTVGGSFNGSSLQQILGFTAISGSHVSFTSQRQALPVWFPNVPAADLKGSFLSQGGRDEDVRTHRAASGQVWSTTYNTYVSQHFTFRGLTKAKVWAVDEVTWGESFESFWYRSLSKGSRRFRYYTDRTSDGSYSAGLSLPTGPFPTYDYHFQKWADPKRIARQVDVVWDLQFDALGFVA